MKRFVFYISIGAITGFGLALIFIFALTITQGSAFRFIFEVPFTAINTGLDFIPGLNFLKERQNPLMSLIVVAFYYGVLGALAGCLILIIRQFIFRSKARVRL